MQGFQAYIQQECILRRLGRPEIPHQLGSCLSDISQLPEFFRISNPMIRIIRHAKSRIFARVFPPVKIAGIHDGPAYAHGMSIHIFRCGMSHDIRPPFKRPAIYRRRKSIIHNKGNLMGMRRFSKFFDIQHYQRRIGDGFRQHASRIILECLMQFFFRSIRIHHRAVDSHLFHCHH